MSKKAKATKPEPSEHELQELIRAAINKAPGIGEKAVIKAAKAKFTVSDEPVIDAATALAAQGIVYRWSDEKKAKYFPHDPTDELRAAVLAELGEDALDEAVLRKRLTASKKELVDLLPAWLASAVAREDLYQHPPAAGSKKKRYGTRSPRPPEPTEQELTDLVRQLVAKTPGVTEKDLQQAADKAFKGFGERAVELAERLSVSGDLYRWSNKTKARFFEADPNELISSVVTRALSNGPLTEADLARLVVKDAPGASDLFKDWLNSAVNTKLVHPHPPASGSKKKRYGKDVDLRAPLEKVLADLQKVVAKERLDPREVLNVIATELGVSTSSASNGSQQRSSLAEPPRPSATSSGTDAQRFLRELDGLAASRKGIALFQMRELRARLDFDKSRFDRLALELSRDGQIILHHHDFPASLSPDERQQLVQDDRGTHYSGIAPRRTS
jgi:hypothetical protein